MTRRLVVFPAPGRARIAGTEYGPVDRVGATTAAAVVWDWASQAGRSRAEMRAAGKFLAGGPAACRLAAATLAACAAGGKKNYSEEERERRRQRLAAVRLRRWPAKKESAQ